MDFRIRPVYPFRLEHESVLGSSGGGKCAHPHACALHVTHCTRACALSDRFPSFLLLGVVVSLLVVHGYSCVVTLHVGVLGVTVFVFLATVLYCHCR